MWLQIPSVISDVLWEGPLELASNEEETQEQRGWEDQNPQRSTRYDTRDLPIVTIGKPEVWPVEQLYSQGKVPPALRMKLEEADFYLARFSCSFRVQRPNSRVEWARFLVRLMNDDTGHQPIAFDMHPLLVVQSVQRNLKVTLGPSVKFQEVEVNLGESEFGFEYSELHPVVSGTGIGEPIPSWDFEEAPGVRLEGGKTMHILIKAPKGTSPGLAILDLTADVQLERSRIAALIKRDPKEVDSHLTVRLWG